MEINSGMFWTIFTIAAIALILIVLTIYYAFSDRKIKAVSGRSGIEGEIGEAATDLNPDGRVLVHGEWWNARANESIPMGAKIRVVKAEKMLLSVVRAPEDA